MPAEPNSYTEVSADYFAKRGLRRYAGVASLWALGVGAVISGHYSGWNLGLLAGGWGGFALAALVIAVMYLGLVFCIAEMGAALPHTGGAYSFARASMGPWGGFITGLCENVEYVLTPAVVVSFLATYLAAVFDTPMAWLPAYWVAGYAVFVGLNVWGVELSFRVTVVVTLAALACLAVFWISALPVAEFKRFALNIGAGPDGTPSSCPRATGRCCRSASRARSRPCPSRSGCSSPSSSSRWPPRNPWTPAATCRAASSRAFSPSSSPPA